jgi:hypothetical protein
LAEVLSAPDLFDPATDLIVTTSTHYEEMLEKLAPGRRLSRIAMSIAAGTASEIAALPSDTRLGVISASPRFSQVMLKACAEYGNLALPVKRAFFNSGAQVADLLNECTSLLLPPNYHLFASLEEALLIKSSARAPIHYRYQVEKGSLLYLEDQIDFFSKTRQRA